MTDRDESPDRGPALPPSTPRGSRTRLWTLLAIWLALGLFVNDNDQLRYTLQHAGVEAIAERGTLYVDGSPTPALQEVGDVFEYDGHLYPAKQPGQFLAGAVVYFGLHRVLGLSYLDDYVLVACLVALFTSCLVTAVATIVIHDLGKRLVAPGGSRLWPVLGAVFFGAGSTMLPYSGLPHHDVLASGSLVFAVAFLLPAGPSSPRPSRAALGSGVFLGLTLTLSALPAPMVAVAGLFGLVRWRLRHAGSLLLGVVLGLAPLLVCNTLGFGNPFLVPNVAGNFSDTFFRPDWADFVDKLGYYAEAVTLHVPLFWCGLLGAWFLPAHKRLEKRLLLAMVGALLLYVLNIETRGGLQYGPRYLLPAMPFVALGLVGFSHLDPSWRRAVAVPCIGLLSFCVAVNVLGALYGLMWDPHEGYGFARYAEALVRGHSHAHPLALWLGVPLIVCLFELLLNRTRRRSHSLTVAGGGA